MRAELNGEQIAEATQDELVKIEGNWYFPPSAVGFTKMPESDTAYNCPWKGDAQYYDIADAEGQHTDMAWSYPQPYPSAFDRVGKDFSGYVAFARDVSIHD